MKVKEIKEMAVKMGVKPGRLRKAELIRTVQSHEGSFDCYGSERIHHCNEGACLWREDCVKEVNTAA